jgi:hypothetical protein
MSTILRTSRHHQGQEIEIFVKYDHRNNEVREIKAVNLKTNGRTYPIGNFMFSIWQFEEAINKIVDNSDWREIYRELTTDSEIDNYLDMVPNVHSVFMKALHPFASSIIIRH